MKKKHKGGNNNDRGAVLSLDDVKRHVSRPMPSPFIVSGCIALPVDTLSSLCPHCLNCSRSERERDGNANKSDEIKMEEDREGKT